MKLFVERGELEELCGGSWAGAVSFLGSRERKVFFLLLWKAENVRGTANRNVSSSSRHRKEMNL